MGKQLNNKKIILLIVLLLVLLIIVLITAMTIKKINENSNNEEMLNKVDIRTEEEKEEEKISKLKDTSESGRIKTYVGTYFKYIEKGDLKSAYELLYPDFKNNYFKTQSDFEEYIENKSYPEMMSIDYSAISTQGKYYLVTINITDFVNPYNKITYTEELTLLEEDYNVYYISFKI